MSCFNSSFRNTGPFLYPGFSCRIRHHQSEQFRKTLQAVVPGETAAGAAARLVRGQGRAGAGGGGDGGGEGGQGDGDRQEPAVVEHLTLITR